MREIFLSTLLPSLNVLVNRFLVLGGSLDTGWCPIVADFDNGPHPVYILVLFSCKVQSIWIKVGQNFCYFIIKLMKNLQLS